MSAKLKLVSNNASVRKTRPIRTEYSSPGWGGVGHSCTVQGALRSAFMRIVSGEFTGATIWNEAGSVTHTIKRNQKGDCITVRKH